MAFHQTLYDLVQRTVTRLSMVSGIGVQVYAEDRIAEMIWHKWLMVRDELWWDDLMRYAVLTQDANGRPMENVVRQLPLSPNGDEIVINDYNDIQHVWRNDVRRPLSEMALRSNPAGMLKQGSTLFRTPDTQKVIRFAPIMPGKKMVVRYKVWHEYFQPDDIVPMDDQLIILGAVYDYLEDDGTNAGQTEKFRNMFNDRLRQMKSRDNAREIGLTPAPFPDSGGYQVIS